MVGVFSFERIVIFYMIKIYFLNVCLKEKIILIMWNVFFNIYVCLFMIKKNVYLDLWDLIVFIIVYIYFMELIVIWYVCVL